MQPAIALVALTVSACGGFSAEPIAGLSTDASSAGAGFLHSRAISIRLDVSIPVVLDDVDTSAGIVVSFRIGRGA
jgi:hypothetical protein